MMSRLSLATHRPSQHQAERAGSMFRVAKGGSRFMIETGLAGKTIVVTRANRGIGAATGQAFATQGALVVLTYLRLSPEDDSSG